jgi:hypothetical protein
MCSSMQAHRKLPARGMTRAATPLGGNPSSVERVLAKDAVLRGSADAGSGRFASLVIRCFQNSSAALYFDGPPRAWFAICFQ